MSESATMEWSGKGRRVVIYDLDGEEAAFRRFMSDYHAAWDEHNLAVPLQRYFRDQLRGHVLDVRPPAYEGGYDVYEVRPVRPTSPQSAPERLTVNSRTFAPKRHVGDARMSNDRG